MANLKTLAAALVAASALLGSALAHPGEKHTAEYVRRGIEDRELAEAHARQANLKCSGVSTHKAMQERAAARRSLAAQLLREKRGVVHKNVNSKRDQVSVDKWMKTCHDETSHKTTFDLSTPEAAIFTSNATHALTPVSYVGPYFVNGEYIRRNVTEGQAGVPVHLDLQFIDISTCEVVPNMLVDIWQANATGTYSGVLGSGGLNTTFLRGVQLTDRDGVVEFDTIYPGHYLGRVNHIHIISRRGGTVLPNGTYAGGIVNHIGQLFFDQELTGLVELTEPYLRNYLPLTSNQGDFQITDAASPDYDPFVDYVMLSDDANDGLLMWITIAINGTADHANSAWPAATYQKGGGVANPWTFPLPGMGPGPTAASGSATAKSSGASSSSSAPGSNMEPPIPIDQIGWPMPSREPAPARATPQPWGPCRTSPRKPGPK